MNNLEDIKSKLADILITIAPDIDPSDLEHNVDLRYTYDIDSMDYLRFIVQLNEEYGIEIPEEDYGDLITLEKMATYILDHRARASKASSDQRRIGEL